MRRQDPVISEYAQMWPRNVYDFKGGKKTLQSLRGGPSHETRCIRIIPR